MVFSFFKYYLRAKTKFDVHSPLVSEFIQEVLEDDRHYYAYDELDYLREEFLRDDTRITVKDLGSGSKKMGSSQRKVKAIAKNSLTTPFFGQLLYRLSLWKKPTTILELGTSLGISIGYLASPHKSARYITLEGCPNTAAIAQQTIDKMGLSKVDIRVGAFSKTLQPALESLKQLDLVFLDGHHALEPTLQYWAQIKPYLSDRAVIIVDDIHWSKGMETAWATISKEEDVSCTLDLFYKGFIFWKYPGVEKQHFSLINSKWKPWRMGFWGG